MPVQLGGDVPVAITDGELMTSVVYPSHRVAARAEPAAVVSGKLSRMGDFSEAMSVRDLIDLVAARADSTGQRGPRDLDCE